MFFPHCLSSFSSINYNMIYHRACLQTAMDILKHSFDKVITAKSGSIRWRNEHLHHKGWIFLNLESVCRGQGEGHTSTKSHSDLAQPIPHCFFSSSAFCLLGVGLIEFFVLPLSVSLHLNFGLPIIWHPPTSMFSLLHDIFLSVFLSTRPNHLSRFSYFLTYVCHSCPSSYSFIPDILNPLHSHHPPQYSHICLF